MFTKYIVAAIAVLAVLVAADDKWKASMSPEAIRQIHAECLAEAEVTSEQEEKIRKDDYADEKEVRDYALCSTKKMGIFTEEGGFSVDRFAARLEAMQVDPAKAHEIAEKCADSNEQKSTPAKWAHRGLRCLVSPEFKDVLKDAVKRQWRNNLFAKGGLFEAVVNSK